MNPLRPMLPAAFWSDEEAERLDEFLVREDGPENTMDVSMLDGFLCAVVSGPKLIMPGEMLRWVFDTEQGLDEPVFRSAEEAQEITGLIIRQWNAINDALTHAPQDYDPLLMEHRLKRRVIPIIDEWCMGYHKGMSLDLEGWMPLLVGQPALLSPILLHGTEEGWEELKRKKVSAAEHRAVADSLGDLARTIHAHWLAQRRAQHASGTAPDPVYRRETLVREGPKIGRNDPCPCGSGRKYKHCHGAG